MKKWGIPRLALRRVIIAIFKLLESTIKFAPDASNGLSHEKLMYHLDKTHPRIVVKDKKSNL